MADKRRGKSIKNELDQELMRTFMSMPGVLDSMVEGKEGPAEVSGDEYAEAMATVIPILMRYIQNLAFEVDRIRFHLELDKEPGPFGPEED